MQMNDVFIVNVFCYVYNAKTIHDTSQKHHTEAFVHRGIHLQLYGATDPSPT